MGVDHGGTGNKSPQNLERGGLSRHILSCCKIFHTRLLALQCRKMCFFLYSRTFIVSPAMRSPLPEFQSDLRLWIPHPMPDFKFRWPRRELFHDDVAWRYAVISGCVIYGLDSCWCVFDRWLVRFAFATFVRIQAPAK